MSATVDQSYEWVEIIEPRRREHMYANLKTGQCLWEPPDGVPVKPTHENQWWELYDGKTKRYYYYNATSQQTVWKKPKDGDIIALAKLQMLKAKESSKSPSSDAKTEKNSQKPTSPSNRKKKDTSKDEEQANQPKQSDRSVPGKASLRETKSEYSEPSQKETDSPKMETSAKDIKSQGRRSPSSENSAKKLGKNSLSANAKDGSSANMYVNLSYTHNKMKEQKGKNLHPERQYENLPTKTDKKAEEPNAKKIDDLGEDMDTEEGHADSAVKIDKSASVRLKPTAPRVDITDKFKANTVSRSSASKLLDKEKEGRPRGSSMKVAPPKPPRSSHSPCPMSARSGSFSADTTNESLNMSIETGNVSMDTSTDEKFGDGVYENIQSCTLGTLEEKVIPKSPEKEAPLSPKAVDPPVVPTLEKTSEKSEVPVPPPAPPIPTAAISSPRRQLPQPGKKSSGNEKTNSVYDNIGRSEGDSDVDDMSIGSGDDSQSTGPGSPSLVQSESTTKLEASLSSKPSKEIGISSSKSMEVEKTPSGISGLFAARSDTTSSRDSPKNTKRSPLTRMQSDSSDMEKRAKMVAGSGKNGDNFRPVSMLDVSGSAKTGTFLRQKLASPDEEKTWSESVPLNTHRKGIWRRRMSIHSMLSWSKSPIKKPMVMSKDKQHRKEAIETFKLILQYMGDRTTRKTTANIGVEITSKGWSTQSLRDEIYIQLCKQTTNNEKKLSLQRGWELITACLSIFPPSSKFQSYLEGFISKRLDDPEEETMGVPVAMYAKHCHKQLERICESGAKRGNRKPTAEDIEAAKDAVFNPSQFGNSFEDIMEMQSTRFPNNRLPWILTTLAEAVLMQNGLQTEGIFRVPGDIDEVNSLKLSVDKWQTPSGLDNPNTPASLLKLWFREMYEPLIPQRFYDTCIHNCENEDVVLSVVKQLPELNRLIFCYLIRFLQAFMIPANVAFSKMDENNLAMVWAPNCLRCPSSDPLEIFENTRKEMTFLRTIMLTLDTSFLQGVV